MKRREFITLVGSTAFAWPTTVRAQQRAMPVIGFLNPNKSDAYPSAIAAFHAGLRESGFVEGENVTMAYRWADGHAERLPALAADLVQMQVSVIAATGGGGAAFAAKAATTTIPIVFNSADDPVKAGLVASLNRPGGNLTGVSRLSTELMSKRLELLHEVSPDAAPIAYLVEANSAVATDAVTQEAARSLGIEMRIIKITTEMNLEDTFAEMVRSGAKAILVGSSSYFNNRSKQLGELCVRYKLPAIYQLREFVAAGGLMSYGPSLPDAYRIVGEYTGRVLKGAQPADLPVQQQSKVDLIVNLKTAKTLGITIPLPLFGRADEVIE
jgi:ABC-type uncharacterized transport system substrate-binding protein